MTSKRIGNFTMPWPLARKTYVCTCGAVLCSMVYSDAMLPRLLSLTADRPHTFSPNTMFPRLLKPYTTKYLLKAALSTDGGPYAVLPPPALAAVCISVLYRVYIGCGARARRRRVSHRPCIYYDRETRWGKLVYSDAQLWTATRLKPTTGDMDISL